MADARASLTDPANFGAGGVVQESALILPDITPPITGSKLQSLDISITSAASGYVPDEAAAVRKWVDGGGVLIFYGDVGVNFGEEGNQMASQFDIGFGKDDFLINPAVDVNQPLHPTIQDPFGTSEIIPDHSGSIVEELNALRIVGQPLVRHETPS